MALKRKKGGRPTIYDRPIRQLLHDATDAMPAVFTNKDLQAWFREHYPEVRYGTLQVHISAAVVNSPTHRSRALKVGDLLYRRPDGRYERYSNQLDGEDHGELGPRSGTTAEEERATRVLPPHEALATLSASLGTRVAPGVLMLRSGLTQRYDLISGDERLVGSVLDFTGSPALHRWSRISEQVWLLQQLGDQIRKVLVIIGDARTPRVWLDNLGRLAEDVDFLLLSGDSVIDLRGNA